jgi:hypothetical protein
MIVVIPPEAAIDVPIALQSFLNAALVLAVELIGQAPSCEQTPSLFLSSSRNTSVTDGRITVNVEENMRVKTIVVRYQT